MTGSDAPSLAGPGPDDGTLPIRMLHDRVLVSTETEAGERRSSGGILIPATVAIGRRLAWGEVVAAGTSVRTVQLGDRVLFDPEDRAEVEVRGQAYVLLRERDLHAVAAERLRGRTNWSVPVELLFSNVGRMCYSVYNKSKRFGERCCAFVTGYL